MNFATTNSILFTFVDKRDSIVPLSHSLAITSAVNKIPTFVKITEIDVGKMKFILFNSGLNQVDV